MKKSFVLYQDQYEPIKGLNQEQKGCLLDAMFLYQMGEPVPESDPIVNMAFSFFKQTFDRDRDKYLKRCEKNKENVRKRWNTKDTNVYDGIRMDTNHTDSGNDKIVTVVEDSDSDIKEKNSTPASGDNSPEKKSKRFIPPTLEEVTEYCHERKNTVDPESFLGHYEANGWMRGKNKIKSWKACVRTWEKNAKPSHNQKPKAEWKDPFLGECDAVGPPCVEIPGAIEEILRQTAEAKAKGEKL